MCIDPGPIVQSVLDLARPSVYSFDHTIHVYDRFTNA